MKKKLLSISLALGMALTLGACGGSSSATSSSQASSAESSSASAEASSSASEASSEASSEAASVSYEPATVTVAYMPNLGSAGSLFAAIQQGYFDEVGLTVETYEFQDGPSEISAMASGDIDISQIGHGAHALCIEGQAVIFQMEHTSLADFVVGNKEKGIEKPEDLAGKSIGVVAGTSSEIILQKVMEKAGLTEDDVNLQYMKVDGMTTAMIAGQIDACATWSPNTVTLQEALGDNYVVLGGVADFVGEGDVVSSFPSSFITTKEYAEANHDILVRFAQAIDKAHVYRAEHTEDLAKYLAGELDAPEDTMLQSVNEADWDTINEIAGDMDAIKKVYEEQQEVFLSTDRITEKVDTNEYVLYDVMQEAYDAFKAAQ